MMKPEKPVARGMKFSYRRPAIRAHHFFPRYAYNLGGVHSYNSVCSSYSSYRQHIPGSDHHAHPHPMDKGAEKAKRTNSPHAELQARNLPHSLPYPYCIHPAYPPKSQPSPQPSTQAHKTTTLSLSQTQRHAGPPSQRTQPLKQLRSINSI